MNAQSIFDTVVTHLKTQGKPARLVDGGCKYRTKDGLKCAVGALVTDEEAGPMDAFNGNTSIMSLPIAVVPERLRPHSNLLSALQSAHDSWNHFDRETGEFDLRLLGNNLRQIARAHGLTFNYEEFLA